MIDTGHKNKAILVGTAILFAAALIVYFAIPTSNWERDHYGAIIALCQASEEARNDSRHVDADAGYKALLALIGENKISNQELRSRIDRLGDTYERWRALAARQRAEELERERNAEHERRVLEESVKADAARAKLEQQAKATKDAAIREQEEKRKLEDSIRERDESLRARSATLVKDVQINSVPLAGGTLVVLRNHRVLWVLTGDYYEGRRHVTLSDGYRPYYNGGSELEVSVRYMLDGKEAKHTDGWYEIAGKPHKVQIQSENREIVDQYLPTIWTNFRPISPGETFITVKLADASIRFPIAVVPLDIASGETTDSVISRHGLPDEEVSVLAVWPDSVSKHNLYYSETPGSRVPRNYAIHRRYAKYPGAVVVFDSQKVINVSTTQPGEWSKSTTVP